MQRVPFVADETRLLVVDQANRAGFSAMEANFFPTRRLERTGRVGFSMLGESSALPATGFGLLPGLVFSGFQLDRVEIPREPAQP